MVLLQVRDVLRRGARGEAASEVWLGGRDSNPDNGVQSAVSYR
jgi:hypothetical protein